MLCTIIIAITAASACGGGGNVGGKCESTPLWHVALVVVGRTVYVVSNGRLKFEIYFYIGTSVDETKLVLLRDRIVIL